jgi:ABC-type glycerol-3-phosphate transport system substrate-binding protein
MKTMMRSIATAGAMALFLAACGGSPTTSAAVDAAGPSFDGGFGMGSGNREAPTDTTTTESSNTTSSESAEQGEYTVGSGN